MGVYIKGIMMPESCVECDLSELAYLVRCKYCTGMESDGCPLVKVPEPHGRLIDAGELVKHCREEDEMFGDWVVDVRRIHNAPTVIEAEEG